jgi:DNA helicase HerA-like ATPase
MIDLHSNIKDRIQKAKALAITLGEIVGMVARHIPSKVEDNEYYYVRVVVDPSVYFNSYYIGKLGIILGTIDIKSLYFVLLRVVGYERQDASSILFGESSFVSMSQSDEEPGSLITNAILKCVPLTKFDPLNNSEPEAADIVIEPQSPVILPRPEVVEKSLSLNRGNLKVGFLHVPLIQAKVSMPIEDLNYHMLILGTTGAGKTSFIKNIIANLYNLKDNSKIFVFDATGDYYHTFLPPEYKNPLNSVLFGEVKEFDISIIYPISTNWAKKYLKGSKDLDSALRVYYNLYVKPLIEYLKKKGIEVYTVLEDNKILISSKEWSGKAKIYPFYFKFKDIRKIIYKLNPYFTEQASHFLKILMRKYSNLEKIDDLISLIENSELENFKIHRSTKENIIRGLYLLKETGLFDVGVKRFSLLDIIKESKVIILDLYNAELDDFSQKILTYYVLDKLFSIREKEMREGNITGGLIIAIDEAHRFFPSGKGSEEDTVYVKRVANKIATMMRLGRRRKIGFIFSTHNPSDLNDIIIQLANTKIIFRIKEEIAESLGLSKADARTLSLERNGVAFMISPWIREGKVKFYIPLPPPLGHYDLSRT